VLRVVCASANPHKVAEMVDLMGGIVEMEPRPSDVPDVVEDADTLVGNARLKAHAIMVATKMPALADDTGLFVDALDGAPGVHTARYAGSSATDADNRSKLLRELAGKSRDARFVTVALLTFPDGREIVAEGVCEGTIRSHVRRDDDRGEARALPSRQGVSRNGEASRSAQLTTNSSRSRPTLIVPW